MLAKGVALTFRSVMNKNVTPLLQPDNGHVHINGDSEVLGSAFGSRYSSRHISSIHKETHVRDCPRTHPHP